jgi:hypothetical protein
MALVWIVYVPTPDLLGPDITRMGRVEDVADDLARAMVGDGSGRWPTDEERAGYEADRAVEEKAAAGGDLSKLSKDELRGLLPEVRLAELGARASKADLVSAVEAHRAEEQSSSAGAADIPASGDGFPQPGGAVQAAILHPDSTTDTAAEEPAGDAGTDSVDGATDSTAGDTAAAQ